MYSYALYAFINYPQFTVTPPATPHMCARQRISKRIFYSSIPYIICYYTKSYAEYAQCVIGTRRTRPHSNARTFVVQCYYGISHVG